MINIILITLLCISIFVGLLLVLHTLYNFKGRLSASFIALTAVLTFYVLGYLLVVLSTSTEAAFTAVMLMYFGSSFFPVFSLQFILEFCEIKIKSWLYYIIMLCPILLISAVWTTEHSHLIYRSFEHEISPIGVSRLVVEHGSLYFIPHIFAATFAIVIFTILIWKMIHTDQENRSTVILIFIASLLPISFDVFYMLTEQQLGIDFAPISTLFLNLVFFIAITKKNLLDIKPKASEIALGSIHEAYILVDARGRLVEANQTAYELFPSLHQLQSNKHVYTIPNIPEALILNPGEKCRLNAEFDLDGDRHFSASITTMEDETHGNLGYVTLVRDITESKRMLHQLEKLAHLDMLTGIMNRPYFFEVVSLQLKQMERNGGEGYIIFFDIDHFKLINDTYGHMTGDLVLQRMAECVRNTIRPYDLFGRYGGEEFLIFVTDITRDNILIYVERIRSSLQAMEIIDEEVHLHITASFGISSITGGQDLKTRIKKADSALYEAKESGRNRVVFAKQDVSL